MTPLLRTSEGKLLAFAGLLLLLQGLFLISLEHSRWIENMLAAHQNSGGLAVIAFFLMTRLLAFFFVPFAVTYAAIRWSLKIITAGHPHPRA